MERCNSDTPFETDPTSRLCAPAYPEMVKVLRSFGKRMLPNEYVPARSVTVHLTEPVRRAAVERVRPGPESR